MPYFKFSDKCIYQLNHLENLTLKIAKKKVYAKFLNDFKKSQFIIYFVTISKLKSSLQIRAKQEHQNLKIRFCNNKKQEKK